MRWQTKSWWRLSGIRVPVALLAAVLLRAATPWAAGAADPSTTPRESDESNADGAAACFTPVVELTVADDNPRLGGRFLVDFDTGKLYAPPVNLLRADHQEAFRWMRHYGIDAMGEGGDDGLVGLDMILRPLDRGPIAEQFPDLPQDLTQRWLETLARQGQPGTPVSLNAKAGVGTSATYLFKTREGATGVIQIVGWCDESQAVHVHYRLLRSSIPGGPQTAGTDTTQTARGPTTGTTGLGRIYEISINRGAIPDMIDLDTGRLLPTPDDGTRLDDWDRYVGENGVDLYVKPKPAHMLQLRSYNMAVVRIPPGWWAEPEKVVAEVLWLRPVRTTPTALLPVAEESPATYIFKTGSGALGVLQITHPPTGRQSVRLRYRLLESVHVSEKSIRR